MSVVRCARVAAGPRPVRALGLEGLGMLDRAVERVEVEGRVGADVPGGTAATDRMWV